MGQVFSDEDKSELVLVSLLFHPHPDPYLIRWSPCAKPKEFGKGAIKEGPGILLSKVMYGEARQSGTMGGLSVINTGVSMDNLTAG